MLPMKIFKYSGKFLRIDKDDNIAKIEIRPKNSILWRKF